MRNIAIIPFEHNHIEVAHDLSKAVGWPHRVADWQMLLNLSEGRVAIADQRVVGTALRTDFGPGLATVNMIIVKQSLRGQGLGRALMDAAMTPVRQRDYRLVATASGRPLYERLGFSEIGWISQYQGSVQRTVVIPGAHAATDADKAAITRLESAAFGGDRGKLVQWLMQNASVAVTRTQTGEVNGFAARRNFGRGHVIGPLVAPDLTAAKALVSYLAAGLTGQFLRLDIAADSALSSMLTDLGLEEADRAPVMARGNTQPSIERFALFSQALG